MAVMDEQTGQSLNYKQLMQDPNCKKNWSTSSANEFGVWSMDSEGALKNPQTQSSSSEERTSQDPEERMLLMVTLCAMSAMKNPRKTGHVSSLEETGSTISVR